MNTNLTELIASWSAVINPCALAEVVSGRRVKKEELLLKSANELTLGYLRS